MKILKFIFPIFSIVFIILIIMYPESSLESARYGLNLWFMTVVPSLLPFFIGSSILINLGVVDFIGTLMEPIIKPLFNCPGSAAYIFIMSITSGYPMGAKLTSQLRQENKISVLHAQRILSFANTSGPLFIIGAVAVGMLGNAKLGPVLCISHYCAAILTGLLFRYFGKDDHPIIRSNPRSKPNIIGKAFSDLYRHQMNQKRKFGEILGEAVHDATNTLLMVGGFIIFFSVIIHILQNIGMIHLMSYLMSPFLHVIHIPTSLSNAIVSGFFEITTGSSIASKTLSGSIEKVAVISAMISWGGLSVHAQALALLGKAGIHPLPYLTAKLIQAIFSYSLCTVILRFFYRGIQPVFLPNPSFNVYSWFTIFSTAISFFIGSLLILCILGLFVKLRNTIRILK